MCNPIRMDAKVWWPLVSRRLAHLLTADAVLLHPKSRGHVRLRSADPSAKPRIEFNALAEPDDLVTLRRGLRAARRSIARLRKPTSSRAKWCLAWKWTATRTSMRTSARTRA